MTTEKDQEDLVEKLVETKIEQDQKEERRSCRSFWFFYVMSFVALLACVWIIVASGACIEIATMGEAKTVDPWLYTSVFDYPYTKTTCTNVITSAYADHPASDTLVCVTSICRY